MAYYYGKDTNLANLLGMAFQNSSPSATTDSQTTGQGGVANKCFAGCETNLKTCLVDAATFDEKEFCRTKAEQCRLMCGKQSVGAPTPPTGG